MASLADQIWSEILDLRRPIEIEDRPRRVSARQLSYGAGFLLEYGPE